MSNLEDGKFLGFECCVHSKMLVTLHLFGPTRGPCPKGAPMTTTERIARLDRLGNAVRGVDRCVANARRSLAWGNESDVALWLDQGETYAGLMTVEEFNSRH